MTSVLLEIAKLGGVAAMLEIVRLFFARPSTQASTKKTEAETDAMVSETWQKYAKKLEERIAQLEKRCEELERLCNTQRDELVQLRFQRDVRA